MANMDNTILARIMIGLSDFNSRPKLWKDWWGIKGFGNGRDGATCNDTSTINRFFSGLGKNKASGRCWWPEEERQSIFEEKIKQKFKIYAENYGKEETLELIQDICKKYNISENKINTIN
mgnify:CR=1 FL=1